MSERPVDTDMIAHILRPVADGIRLALERMGEAKDSAVSWQRYEFASQLRDVETMLLEWRHKLDELGAVFAQPESESNHNGEAENRIE